MSDPFEDVLNQYSDEDLERMAQEKGLGGLFADVTGDALFGPAIKQVRGQLEGLGYRVLSDEVEDYFLDEKAKFVVMNDGLMLPRMGKDDRLADNFDNVLAHFETPGNIELPYAKHEQLERIQASLSQPENEVIGEFLMRTPPEYLKLLIYYAKAGSFGDLRTIFDKFDEKKDEISQYTRRHQGGNLSVIDHHPVEFVSALHGRTLESVFKRTQVGSVDDYNKLFLDAPYMTDFVGSVPAKVLDYVMRIAKVDSVDSMVSLTANDEFRDALSNVDSSGAYPDNLVTAMDYFRIDDLEGMQEIIEFQRTRGVMQKASNPNFSTLMRISGIETPSDLERLCNNAVVSENIAEADYQPLDDLLADLGVEPEQRDVYMYEVVTHSYNRRTAEHAQRLSTLLGQRDSIPNNLNGFITTLMHDEDYIEQNFDSVIQLMQNDSITTEAHVDSLTELKELMGGFVTPELSKRYLQAENQEARTEVLTSYRSMMGQVLGSSKIEIEDPDMAAEIVYLAYRPTGYSISQVKSMIGHGWDSLEDLTHQLDNIKFDRDGYTMHFNFVEREQIEEYDSESLRKIDTPVVAGSTKTELKDLLFQALSGKPKHEDALPTLFGQALERMCDDRVTSYRENYHSGKGVSQEYTEQRLESLGEILGIIPKEDAFYEALTQLIQSDDELKATVQNNADRYQWKRNKRHFSPEERTSKNKLDEVIKHLERYPNSDVSGLLSTEELSPLGDEITGLENGQLYEQLVDIRAKKFLGYGEGTETAVDVFYQALLQHTKSCSGFVKREMKKVEAVKSDEVAEVKAVVSKNVGSYFAKAGAEICTSHNTRMWNEERHSHLNLVYKDQIIGNVMLYFEPERDYMVVRGFNPRKDTMMRFDRYSMAAQITGVLEQIAEANGYSEVFVPEQTGWHALSNRDGMAKEVIGISRKNSNRVQEQYPGQRTTIDDAQFYVTEAGGHSINRLNLLTLVK
jgi:hypothetical protein